MIKFRGKDLRSCSGEEILEERGEKMEDELRPSGNEQEEGEEGFLWRKLTVLTFNFGLLLLLVLLSGPGKCISVGLVRRIQEECLKGW